MPIDWGSACQRGKAIVEKRDVIVPIVRVGKGHRDERFSAALRGADQNASRVARVAGFYPDTAVTAPQKLVMIDQRSPRATNALRCHNSAKLWVFKCLLCQTCQIERGGIILSAVKPVRIRKMRIRQTQRSRTAVHLPDKGRLRTAYRDGQRQRRVVSGMQQHPVQ